MRLPQVGTMSWLGAIVVCLLSTMVWADELTARDGRVTRSPKSDNAGHDPILASSHIIFNYYSITLGPPSGYLFQEFPDKLLFRRCQVISPRTPLEAEASDGTSIQIVIPKVSGMTADQYPLRAWGNLTPPGSGGGGGPGDKNAKHWSAGGADAAIKVVKVPRYLYARATADIPVQFKITGLENRVKLKSVVVDFYVDGTLSNTSSELVTRTGADKGLDSVVNNSDSSTLSDTYTVWVPIAFFSTCQTPGRTSDKVAFRVTVVANNYTNPNPTDTTIQSDKDADKDSGNLGNGCNPAVYGDSRINVIELDVNPDTAANGNHCFQWSVLDTVTEQERVAKAAIAQSDHVGGIKTHGETYWYPCCLNTFEKKHPLSKCWEVLIVGGKDRIPIANPWERYHFTSKKDVRTPGDNTHIKTEAEIYKEWSLCDASLATFRSKVCGETISGYFGVSYGHTKPLGGSTEDGIDIRKEYVDNNGKATGSGIIDLFSDGQWHYTAISENNGTAANLGLTLGGSAITIGGSLAGPAWGTVAAVGASFCAVAEKLTTPSTVNSAEAALEICLLHRSPKDPADHDPIMIFKSTQQSGKDVDYSHAASAGDHSMEVGDTWVLQVTSSSAVVMKSESGWNKMTALSQYSWTSPLMRVRSTKN